MNDLHETGLSRHPAEPPRGQSSQLSASAARRSKPGPAQNHRRAATWKEPASPATRPQLNRLSLPS
jgi:hypothetical protein